MGRTQRALTSLVAAIPAGFLGYLLLMVFLNQADSLNTTMQIVVGATLLVAAIVALMPFILLIPGRKPSAAASAGSGSGEDIAVEVMDDEGSGELASSAMDLDDSAETSDYDLADSDADVLSDSSAELDTKNNSSFDDIDAFDMDDDEEEPPAKKRKK